MTINVSERIPRVKGRGGGTGRVQGGGGYRERQEGELGGRWFRQTRVALAYARGAPPASSLGGRGRNVSNQPQMHPHHVLARPEDALTLSYAEVMFLTGWLPIV